MKDSKSPNQESIDEKVTPSNSVSGPASTNTDPPTGLANHHNGSDNSTENYKYRCPCCSASYGTELNTRVHVTRSDDVDHLNYNGLMPEIEIEKIDATGEVVETISRRPDNIDLSNLTLDDFPSDRSERHKHILLVAARNPYEIIYTELTELVESRLEDTEIETPSYSTVRRVVREFYRPQQAKSSEADLDADGEALGDLTPKQQAIVIARVLSPDEPAATIADRVGCAASYPPQVSNRAGHIISRLERQTEDVDHPADVFRSELTDKQISELEERGLLTDVPIDLQRDGDPENNSSEMWGSPSTTAMTAAPQNLADDDTETDSDQVEPCNSEQAQLGTSACEESTDSGEKEATQTIPRDEIKDLQEKVEFLRDVFSHSVEGDGSNMAVLVADQVVESCEAILQEESA